MLLFSVPRKEEEEEEKQKQKKRRVKTNASKFQFDVNIASCKKHNVDLHLKTANTLWTRTRCNDCKQVMSLVL